MWPAWRLCTSHQVPSSLRSATCDVKAYSAYLSDVAEGRLARVQINDLGLSLRTVLMTTTGAHAACAAGAAGATAPPWLL